MQTSRASGDAGVASLRERHRPTIRDPDRTPEASRRAPSAPPRASRSSTRRPTSVPIYQTATFASADADELGRVAADGRAGYAYSRISNPTTSALGARLRRARRRRGRRRARLGHGAPSTPRSRRCVRGRRPGRRPDRDRTARRGPSCCGTFGGFGVTVDFVDTTDLDAVAAALAAAPTRVLYAETIANPTTFLADHAALADLAHRHGATYVVDNTFASPYVCRPLELGRGPRRRIGDEVPRRPQRRHRRGRRRRRGRSSRAVERVQIDTGATLGPLDAFLVLRGHPDPRRPGRAPRRDGRGTGRLARASGRRASRPLSRACRAIPSTTSRCASSGPASPAGCSPSRWRAAAPPAGRSSTR